MYQGPGSHHEVRHKDDGTQRSKPRPQERRRVDPDSEHISGSTLPSLMTISVGIVHPGKASLTREVIESDFKLTLRLVGSIHGSFATGAIKRIPDLPWTILLIKSNT